jgi:CRISPR-associated endoribonuclease Cas6
MYRMEKSGLYKASEIEQFYQFQLIPDKDYLQKLLLEDKKAARSYFLYEKGEVANELIGYTFPFQLYAHPKVQEFIFLAGFGEATNQGYGMLDVVRTSVEDAKKVIKTPDYKLENSTRIEKNKMFNPLVSVYNMFR